MTRAISLFIINIYFIIGIVMVIIFEIFDTYKPVLTVFYDKYKPIISIFVIILSFVLHCLLMRKYYIANKINILGCTKIKKIVAFITLPLLLFAFILSFRFRIK